jgi:NAD(P)H-dependent FMN reductase
MRASQLQSGPGTESTQQSDRVEKRIRAADAVLIVTPEYNYSISDQMLPTDNDMQKAS